MEIGDNTIDSRDVISRIAELRKQFSDTPFGDEKYTSVQLQEIWDNTPEEWRECIEDATDLDELIMLVRFQEDAETVTCEWNDGATFILDDYFQTYAQELAEDMGTVNRESRWPNDHIDWAAAAEALKTDYSCIESSGYTYYVRA